MAKHSASQTVQKDVCENPKIKEIVSKKLLDQLMNAVKIEAVMGETIVSLEPTREIPRTELDAVSFVRSVRLTPLVRCQDCILARKPDRRKPAENRACEGTLICCVGFDHVYPDTDDGLIFVDENFYCAEGKSE